jgi:hypothetical protein
MSRGLSLATLVSLLMGAVLVSAVSAHIISMNLWLERRADVDQKIGAALIASEINRLIKVDFAKRGNVLAPEFVQPLIHSRWVRDSDIQRISVVTSDAKIIADTEVNRIGTTAPAAWSATAASERLREVVDQSGQKTHIVTVHTADRRDLCNVIFQLSPSPYRDDLYRAFEAMLRLGIPLLMLAVIVFVGIGVFVARKCLRQALGGSPAPTHPDDPLSATIGRLEDAAAQLRTLAEK